MAYGLCDHAACCGAYIAAHFDMVYEDMLALGRRILDGNIELVAEGKEEVVGPGTSSLSGDEITEGGTVEFHEPQNTGEAQSNISETILKMLEILESGGPYGGTLRGSIDVLYEAVSTKNENLYLRNQIIAMDSRVAKLEGILSDKKNCS